MRKISLLCCAAVARVCKQRLREGFQTKGFPEDNITTSGMYLRILWRDFVKPSTEKPFALESNFLVRLCFFVTKGKEEPFRGIATSRQKQSLPRNDILENAFRRYFCYVLSSTTPRSGISSNLLDFTLRSKISFAVRQISLRVSTRLGWAVGVAALWGYSLSVDECLGAILPRRLQCNHCFKQS